MSRCMGDINPQDAGSVVSVDVGSDLLKVVDKFCYLYL